MNTTLPFSIISFIFFWFSLNLAFPLLISTKTISSSFKLKDIPSMGAPKNLKFFGSCSQLGIKGANCSVICPNLTSELFFCLNNSLYFFNNLFFSSRLSINFVFWYSRYFFSSLISPSSFASSCCWEISSCLDWFIFSRLIFRLCWIANILLILLLMLYRLY